MSIPFFFSQGDYFTIEQEYNVMLLLEDILNDPAIAKRGATNIFDLQFMLHKYNILPAGNFHCTQIAQKIAFPDLNSGLEMVASLHTDIPYYKSDGKQWMKIGGSFDTWWTYNNLDSMATAAAHPNQMEELYQQGNFETYERQRKLVEPLLYMMERGIKIDVEGMIKEAEETKIKIEEGHEKLNQIVGYDINFNSPQQLMEYFYERKGLKPYKKKKGQAWVDTTDETALKQIARKGFEEANIVLDLRSLQKRLSTYLNPDKLDPDGRYRSQYKPAGTDTGRLASGETIFGTGGNQQNWPHDLLKYFIFDAGYMGYSVDLSQVENRIVAYVGKIVSMIEAFEKGIDVHALTASLMLGKPIDEISDEDGSSPLGNGRQSERFWGKKTNHELNYNLGYVAFALQYMIPEREAKWLLERYHRAYPGVRNNYQAMVKHLIKTTRVLTNLMGRKRVFLGPVTGSGSYKTFNTGFAQIPQSTTADVINERGIEHIYYNQHLFKPVELLTQIHDSVVFQIPTSTPWIEHAKILTLIKDKLETPLVWEGREFVVPVDITCGSNMCKEEMEEIKAKNFPASTELLAKQLEEIYVRKNTP
jgi:DNA polymerase I-like protein with 3'-5' exonuclease and polymerase domains